MRTDLIAQINIENLVHNYRALRACCRPNVRFCAALKADAYGHGVEIVAPILQEAGADYAAVATLDEAVELREIGWEQPILVLGNVLAVANPAERRERIEAIAAYRLALTLVDEETVLRLRQEQPRRPMSVHLKLDSGMGRMGAVPSQIARLLQAILETPSVRLTGFYSHLASADFRDLELARNQLEVFTRTLAELDRTLPPGVLRHLANSAATIAMPEAHFDMVRPGLAMYGYLPAKHMSSLVELKPVLRLVSHLTAVKDVEPGHCVGYGQTFTTSRPTRLGIVPAGYFDGFPRSLSNLMQVGTPHGPAPSIGRISMDQMAVDLTDLPPMPPGTEIVLIDDRADRPNSVEALAQALGTIPYEVTCLLGPRVSRVSVRVFPSRPDSATPHS